MSVSRARAVLLCLLLAAAGAELASAARPAPGAARRLLQRGVAQDLATLNAQSAVYSASLGGTNTRSTVGGTMYATGYAQRSAIGATFGNTPYLSRQDNFDTGVGSYFWGKK